MRSEDPENDACGCCSNPVGPERTNRPGLSAIRYRAGTYSSIRHAMIDSIGSLFEDGDGKSLPLLKGWRAREKDYGIAFIEMWAYLADILTFYQERIANEAFLRTAVHFESLHMLAALLDYRPAPGVAATNYLAFFAEKGKEVKIPIGLRVQSIPGEGERPQKFETVEEISARFDLNSVRVRPKPEAVNPFIADAKNGRLDQKEASAIAKVLRPGDRFVLFFKNKSGGVEEKVVKSIQEEDSFKILEWSPEIQSTGRNSENTSAFKFTRKLRLFGYNAPDKYLQSYSVKGIVRWKEVKEGFNGYLESTDASTNVDYTFDLPSSNELKLDTVYDLKIGTPVLISFVAKPSSDSPSVEKPVYALRKGQDFAFISDADLKNEMIVNQGYFIDATAFYVLSDFIDGETNIVKIYKKTNMDEFLGYALSKRKSSTQPLYKLSKKSGTHYYYYTTDERIRDSLIASGIYAVAEVAGYIPAMEKKIIKTWIKSTSQVAASKGPLNATVTGITLADALPAIESIRNVEIYELDREIVFSSFKYPEKIEKGSDSVYVPGSPPSGLAASRTVILDDKMRNPQVVVVSADGYDQKTDHTIVRLNEPLKRDDLDSGSAVLNGNIARATHGEAVKAEVLGDGDASASFQSFAVSKKPVTFVPAPGAGQGAETTLKVRVDGIEWKEARDLLGHGPRERIYTTSVDATGLTTVHFGDGIDGSRLPRGKKNVVASYRQGSGRAGEVRAGTLTSLLDRPLGLKSVTNPGKAQGGAEMESLDDVRRNAPNTVRTFDRIVSLKDFEDAAREYRSWKVAKARARRTWSGTDLVIRLIVAGVDGRVMEDSDPQKKLLWDHLSKLRDPNIELELRGHKNRSLQIRAEIRVRSGYDEDAVLKAARSALIECFSFNKRDLGEAVHLAGVYSVLHDLDGIEAARVLFLELKNGQAAASTLASQPGPWLPRIVASEQGIIQMHLDVATDEIAFVDGAGEDVVVEIWRDNL